MCGRIDSDSANLIEIVGQCVRDGYTDVLCNFETVESIDYLGVSAIVIAYKEIVNNKNEAARTFMHQSILNPGHTHVGICPQGCSLPS